MKVGELGEEMHKDSGGAFYEPSFLVGSILWSLVMSSGIDKVTSWCVCVCCFLELGEDQCFLIKIGMYPKWPWSIGRYSEIWLKWNMKIKKISILLQFWLPIGIKYSILETFIEFFSNWNPPKNSFSIFNFKIWWKFASVKTGWLGSAACVFCGAWWGAATQKMLCVFLGGQN